MPSAVVTVTSTVPAASAGVTAVRDVEELITNDTAVAVPKATRVAVVKWVPVRVTLVRPPLGPELTLRAVTVGRLVAAVTVNWSADEVAEVPHGLTMVTSTVPVAWIGEVAVMDPSESTVKV